MSYCHSSTGYHVVARQQWHFLLLRAVWVIERGRGREVSHVSLVGVMAGSAYSNITPRCAHTNTRAQPKNPLVCDDRLRLSARPAATLFPPPNYPSLSPLSCSVSLSLPLFTSASPIGFCYPGARGWLLPSTPLSRPVLSPLKAFPVVL